MTLIAIFITILYLVLIGSLIYGFDKVNDFLLKDLKPKTKFSIVIPFRNEASNLPAMLESISKLNYPKELFEIILIDDESDDDSVAIIETYFEKNLDLARIDRTLLKNDRHTKSPKKEAITNAILHAKYDWIITTDADCMLPKYWLDSFDECIQTQGPEFIVAPITYSKTNTFLDRFQLLDVMSLQSSTIGGFGIGKPFLCNGANLAYTKQLFNSLKGFEGNTDIGSGDDIFILEKVVKNQPTKVRFLKCEQAIVTTMPQPTADALMSQRIRWAAKASAYQNWFGKFASIVVFLMNGGLFVFGLLTLVGILKTNILIYILVIKFGIDFLLIYKTAIFMNQKEVMKSYFFAFLIYPFFSVYVAFASIFKGYKWKGRDYVK
jgi:cellulose synthase/poly-beta-1,6-N-acetylglucosamine synthase-like glycosyltransferase